MATRRVGVAEGAGLAHDAGNLLGALSLYSELLAMPGVLHEEYREYAAELRLLSDRSWAMIDRLVNHARVEQATEMQAETTVLPEVVERCRGLLSRVAGRTVDDLVWGGCVRAGAGAGGGGGADSDQPGEECGGGDAVGRSRSRCGWMASDDEACGGGW